MLSDAEIEGMQATVESAMPSVAEVRRIPDTKNDAGGRSGKPAVVDGLDAVPCHVSPDTQRGAQETDEGSALHAVERYRLIFPAGTDVRDGDTVLVDDGGRFEIVQTDTPRSWALEVEALGVRHG